MMQVLAAIALVLGGFILGMWACVKIHTLGLGVLRKNKVDITIEDREEGMIAVVMRMPDDQRELVEKLVEKVMKKMKAEGRA